MGKLSILKLLIRLGGQVNELLKVTLFAIRLLVVWHACGWQLLGCVWRCSGGHSRRKSK